MKFRILCLILLLTASCDKTENPDDSGIYLICGIDAEVDEIVDPPEIPAVYSPDHFEPKIIVKNADENTVIRSLDIDYLIDINNMHNGYEKGPQTRWTGTLNFGEEVTIILNEWDTATGNTHLNNGVHSIIFEISGVNDSCVGNILNGIPILRQFQLER